PPQGDAARPLRRGPRRRRRGHLERRRLLQGQPHPGQALRGVQGAARREPSRLQGADPDAPGGRPVIPELGYGAAIVALVLALWGAVTAADGARELYPWVLTVMLGVLAFFLLVITVAAPPFARQAPVPADGRGLNPLLEDTGMITHPVALYLGFTGLTVPFAFAMAALITGRV